MSYTQGSRPVLGYVALPGLITRKFMPIRDVSGIGAWGMLYLCSEKSSKELTQKIRKWSN